MCSDLQIKFHHSDGGHFDHEFGGHFDHEFVGVFLNTHANCKDNCLISFLIIYKTPHFDFFNHKTHLESEMSPSKTQ